MRTRLMLFCMIAACVAYGLTVVQAAEPRTYQTKNMFQAGNPAILKPGGATLYRSSQGLEMRVATSGLLLGSSYTVWWVIFNNPSACVGGCGADDLGNPAVRASVLYAAGFVTGLSDTGNVTAHLEAGAPADGADFVQLVDDRVGLEPGNGFRAEVHIIVRTHGLTNVGHVDAQIGSFNGGCNPACTNVQAAAFPPV